MVAIESTDAFEHGERGTDLSVLHRPGHNVCRHAGDLSEAQLHCTLKFQLCSVDSRLKASVTQSESVWVMAQYGPACGDIVVR